SLLSAFSKADDVLLGAVQGIADLIIRPGMINVDFADVKTVMGEMGMAMMGTGHAIGPNRAREAAEAAIRSPLLEDVNLMGARGVLVNITAGPDLSLGEFSEVGNTVEEFASESATVVVATVLDPELREELRVTVVATGRRARRDQPLQVVGDTAAPVQPSRPPESMATNYRGLERPTVMRNSGGVQTAETAHARPSEDLDYLD